MSSNFVWQVIPGACLAPRNVEGRGPYPGRLYLRGGALSSAMFGITLGDFPDLIFFETQRRKSPTGTSSTGRALPLRVTSTAAEVQDGEYFQAEDIRDWRQGEGEYLVKWEGYGHKHNTWEPATHFEECPEVLEEFHQKAGLSTAPSM